METNVWTRQETIVAFNLYCKIPFGKIHKNNPEIIELAEIIGRTPSSVGMKLGNFGRLDPELKKRGVGGLANGAKLEEIVWNEFNGNWDDLAFESEELLAGFKNKKLQDIYDLSEITEFPPGAERQSYIKSRVNQGFFRNAVLSAYNNTCCVTGLSIPGVLIASHIKPWKSSDPSEKTNPQNGLCLNALHDKAFDLGFITIGENFDILVSKKISEVSSEESVNDFFMKYNNQKIILPQRFFPDIKFLEYHRINIFQK
jgi:putative restriction endonuclease